MPPISPDRRASTVACAVPALLLGPLALTARKGSRLHRAAGYAWVTLMLGAAFSALFIHGRGLPNLAGFSPIHLLVPLTLWGIGSAVWRVTHGDVAGHRQSMTWVYWSAGVGAGVFALLPGRWLGQLVWGQWLGLL